MMGFDPADLVNYADNNYLDIYENVNGHFDLQTDPTTIDELLSLAGDIDLS